MARCYTEPKEEEAMHYTRIAPQLIPLLSSLVIATLISGCASVHSLKTTEETQPLDLSVLEQAAEEFYAAPGGEPMEKALERALAAGPDSAIAHELGFLQAYYKDQPSIAFDHLVEALRDPLNDAPLLHLHLLQVLPWSHRERHIVQPLLRTLKEDHPDPFVRDLATHHLSK